MSTSRCPTSLLDLPGELFDHITDNLDPQDKLSFYLTSKTIQGSIEPPFYSCVHLYDKDRLNQFLDAVTSKPYLPGMIKQLRFSGDSFRIDSGAYEPSICISRCPRLSHLTLEPKGYIHNGELTAPLTNCLAPIMTLQSLTSLTIWLTDIHAGQIASASRQLMLETIMTMPSIKVLSIKNWLDLVPEYEAKGLIRFARSLLANPETTRFTDLKDLTFEWRRLPLQFTSALLKYPRSLEKLVLVPLPLPKVSLLPLDSVLEGLEDSLRELTVTLGVRYPITSLWSSHGLQRFSNLRSLKLPARSIPVESLPPSLVDLYVRLSQLFPIRRGDGKFDPTGAVLRLDNHTARLLNRMSTAVDRLPSSLKHIKLDPEFCDIDDFFEGSSDHSLPVAVDKNSQALVDREFKIIYTSADWVPYCLPIQVDATHYRQKH